MDDPRKFQHVAELFEAARSRDGADREAFLEDACGDSPDVLAEVRRLLDRHDHDGVLDAPLVSDAARDEIERAAPAPQHPARIAQYEVKRRLASGGMGIVYLAEQDNPRREVAIKVIRPGLVSRELLKRFDLEAAVLGRLKHPGIAQIYAAGTYDDGSGARPYFAMEYVDGAPLVEYARDRALDVRARLETFTRICDAVEHAHQRGIIHRDLKPANVLVDQTGQPKILDFGVARATDSDMQVSTLQTDVGQLIGTVAYMSPEQVRGRAGDIDTRSDVYALGVVLYELLADRLPYDLRDRSIAAVAAVISEHDPTPLTTVNRSFRGDLDTIVQKALEKDPDRRYQSASALAADVRRFLGDEPIVARPATTMYQLRKFARRNRGLVAGIAAAFVVLIAGVVVSTTLAIGQTRALAESERQRAIATAVNDFLTEDLIEQADPDHEANREITLVEAIDQAAERIEGRFEGAPIVEANLHETIGVAYGHLDRLDDADRHLTRALELFEGELDADDEEVLMCRMHVATILMDRADYEAAEPFIRELLALQREVLGGDHVQTIASLSNLGSVLARRGKFEEAEAVLDEALERRLRVLGEMDSHTATTMNNLATVYSYTGRLDESESMYSRALAVLREVSGDRHPQTLQTMANLGGVYGRLRRLDDAISTLEESLTLHRSVLGEDHRATLAQAGNLATIYGFNGQRDEEESLLRETIEVQRRVVGEEHLDTLTNRMKLAKIMFDRGDYDECATEHADLVERLDRLYPGHFVGGITRATYGRCLIELEQYERAEEELERSYDLIASAFGDDSRDTRGVARYLVALYERWDKPEEAERWRRIGSSEIDE